MPKKPIYNLKAFQELREGQNQELAWFSQRTRDPKLRDLCKFTIRDNETSNKIHLARLKFKTK